MPRHPFRAAGLAVAATAALVAGLVVTPASAGAAADPTYVTTRPTCSTSAQVRVHCFASKRVRVSAAKARAAHAHVLTRRPGLAYGPAGGYTPALLAKAYGLNPNAATDQVVGIVDAYNTPTVRADLQTFDARYGIRTDENAKLRIVSQRGGTTDLPADDGTQSQGDFGWSTETSLDVQAVRAVCRACTILLVEADSSDSADLDAAVDTAVRLGADEVSNSYGGPESTESAEDRAADAKAFNHPGVVITASTGDDGMFDWDFINYPTDDTADFAPSSESPELPSAFNTVVAVGGTSLQLNDDGTRASESVWNSNGPVDTTGVKYAAGLGATGGGCSTLYAAQTWQRTVAGYGSTGCGSKRLAADVSALADPLTGFDVLDTLQIPGVNECSGDACWATFGGTSLSSPLIAAMWALAGGARGLRYPSLALYGHSRSVKGSLYDVTAGGNGFCGGVSPGSCEAVVGQSPNTLGVGTIDCAWQGATQTPNVGTRACDAATGYDGPSGVGTPNGVSAFTPLNPTARITGPAAAARKRSTAFSAASSTDPYPGGSISHVVWSWGDGSAVSRSLRPHHTWAKAGRYTVSLTVTDNYGRVSAAARRTVTVK